FFFLHIHPPPRSTLFPYTTLFRSSIRNPKSIISRSTQRTRNDRSSRRSSSPSGFARILDARRRFGRRSRRRIWGPTGLAGFSAQDRKSTRLNSSHLVISYAVFCLK